MKSRTLAAVRSHHSPASAQPDRGTETRSPKGIAMATAPLTTPDRQSPARERSRTTTRPLETIEAVSVAPDLLADLITASAKAAASDVVEAQFTAEPSAVYDALGVGLGAPLAKLLKNREGIAWASLYFRAFMVTLHAREVLVAAQIITVDALLAFLSLRFEHDESIPAGHYQGLQNAIFGRPQ